MPDLGLEISLLYFARHSEDFIQIENVYICTVSNSSHYSVYKG